MFEISGLLEPVFFRHSPLQLTSPASIVPGNFQAIALALWIIDGHGQQPSHSNAAQALTSSQCAYIDRQMQVKRNLYIAQCLSMICNWG